MGYSPWNDKKSDVTEYASKNALIKIEVCVGSISEIKCHCTSEGSSWVSPLPAACPAHQNTQFSLFLFSVLTVSSKSKNNYHLLLFRELLIGLNLWRKKT